MTATAVGAPLLEPGEDPIARTVLWILWCAYGTLVIRGFGDTPAAGRLARAIASCLEERRRRAT